MAFPNYATRYFLCTKACFSWLLFNPLLTWNKVTFLQQREESLTWRVEIDNVFHCEVSGLSSFQTISQQAQEQKPGQRRARFHGRPTCHSYRGPQSGDSRWWERTCTWNMKTDTSQCPAGESHRKSGSLWVRWAGERQVAQSEGSGGPWRKLYKW